MFVAEIAGIEGFAGMSGIAESFAAADGNAAAGAEGPVADKLPVKIDEAVQAAGRSDQRRVSLRRPLKQTAGYNSASGTCRFDR